MLCQMVQLLQGKRAFEGLETAGDKKAKANDDAWSSSQFSSKVTDTSASFCVAFLVR